jgi:glucans biosynthesis protein C
VCPTWRERLDKWHVVQFSKNNCMFVWSFNLTYMNQQSFSSTPLEISSTRQYELDWLRVLAFGLLIFYHTGMFFVSWGWHVKNAELATWMELPMIWVNRWRMPLLFLISGMSVFFLLKKRSIGSFVGNRFTRLFIPLVFGMLVIVPPQIYFERLSQGATFGYLEFWGTVFQIKPYPEGNLSWHHLWYLPYIFAYSLLGLPIWLGFKTDRGQKFIARLAFWAQKPLVLFVPVILWHWLANFFIDFPTTHNFTQDWENHFHSFSLFILGFVLAAHAGFRQSFENHRKLSLGLALGLGVVLTFGFWLPDYRISPLIEAVYELLNTTYSWAALCTIFGYAAHYLNQPSPLLTYCNRAVYPFYILHQSVIICLAYPMTHWGMWPIGKFGLIVLGTFGVCYLLYELLIRRVGIFRLLFGVSD